MTKQIDKIMEQAQVFASAWSLVGGRFDGGNAMDDAEVAKNELHQMVAEALAEQPARTLEELYELSREVSAEQPAQQEPYGYVYEVFCLPECAIESEWVETFTQYEPDSDEYTRNVMPLYASPQPAQRKPLTDDEFTTAIEVEGVPVEDIELAYAIKDIVEAAHGIKEQQ